MENTPVVFGAIDNIIERIDKIRNEPLFTEELKRRNEKFVEPIQNDTELLQSFAYLIAYSQNANSELVERLINSGNLKKVLANFNFEKVSQIDPIYFFDNVWKSDGISVIRFKKKITAIIGLAKILKGSNHIIETFNKNKIPVRIMTIKDVDQFWDGFDFLLQELKIKQIPYFKSTISLLHFLLHNGYDCLKPDLVVMKVAKDIGIVKSTTGETNLRKVVRIIQEYCISRNIRPAVVDFYFLIEGKQKGALKYIK